jgi:WD40 repeat protein
MKPITHIEDGFINGITSVAFRPAQGDYLLAAGSLDNSITLFNVNVVQPLSQDVTSGKGEVISLVELPDGTQLLAGRTQNGLNIWRISGSQEDKTALTYIPTAAAFSPDGKLLALGEKDGEVRLLDAANGQEVRSFSNSKNSILSLAFSPDGKNLASSQCLEFAGGDDTLSRLTCTHHATLIWDVASGKVQSSLNVDQSAAYVQTRLTGHRGTVRALAFDNSGTRLATGSEDLTIQLWDLASGQPVGIPLAGNSAAVTSLAFSPDGATLASGSADRNLTLWDLASNQPVGKPLAGSPGVILSLGYDPKDGRILLSGDSSGNVLQWDVDPDSWAVRNCSLAERNLTQAEWQQLISDQPYHITCEQFAPGE